MEWEHSWTVEKLKVAAYINISTRATPTSTDLSTMLVFFKVCLAKKVLRYSFFHLEWLFFSFLKLWWQISYIFVPPFTHQSHQILLWRIRSQPYHVRCYYRGLCSEYDFTGWGCQLHVQPVLNSDLFLSQRDYQSRTGSPSFPAI